MQVNPNKSFTCMVPKIAHRVMYTNWKGETRERTIVPITFWFGSTEFHTEPQWFVQALDQEKDQIRDFALKDMAPIIKG